MDRAIFLKKAVKIDSRASTELGETLYQQNADIIGFDIKSAQMQSRHNMIIPERISGFTLDHVLSPL